MRCDPNPPGPSPLLLAIRSVGFFDGAALHIIIGDENVEDEHIEFCRGRPEILPPEAEFLSEFAKLDNDDRFRTIAIRDNIGFRSFERWIDVNEYVASGGWD